MNEIIVAIITGVLTLAGVIITCISSRKKITDDIMHQLDVKQAVTDCKIEELTREVRIHNNFAQRVPVLEEQIKVANHRISDAEEEIRKEKEKKK